MNWVPLPIWWDTWYWLVSHSVFCEQSEWAPVATNLCKLSLEMKSRMVLPLGTPASCHCLKMKLERLERGGRLRKKLYRENDLRRWQCQPPPRCFGWCSLGAEDSRCQSQSWSDQDAPWNEERRSGCVFCWSPYVISDQYNGTGSCEWKQFIPLFQQPWQLLGIPTLCPGECHHCCWGAGWCWTIRGNCSFWRILN